LYSSYTKLIRKLKQQYNASVVDLGFTRKGAYYIDFEELKGFQETELF